MAFFKFRNSADEAASASQPAPSVEAIRQRAKYRLVGATVLVLAGVIGLPLLFDKQPRPIAVDTPIDIPDRAKQAPLAIPSAPATSAIIADAPVSAPQSAVITESAEGPKKSLATDNKVAIAQVEPASNATREVAKDASKPSTAPPVTLATSAPAARPVDAARAQALLEGKAPEPKAADTKASAAQPAASESRFVVQVGAFAENTRAHDVRLKLEQAGLKTYAQVAETKDGRRIRVRAGPFATRGEADKAAEKIKKLNLPAAVLIL